MCLSFHCAGNVRVRVPIYCLCSAAEDKKCELNDQRREGMVEQVENVFARLCARNYYGSRFTALRQVLIQGTSPVPGPSGDCGDKI